MWSGQQCHPDDLRTCNLTGALVHFSFMVNDRDTRLEPLVSLLDGARSKSDKPEIWPLIEADSSRILGNKNCNVEQTLLSPDGQRLATCMEIRTFLGLRLRHAGLIYSAQDKAVVGRIARGMRVGSGWVQN